MYSFETFIGAVAAICTTVSYVPQVKKCWSTGHAQDISLKMLLLLAAGLICWVAYGFLRGDMLIVIANLISLSLLACILYCKLRGDAKEQSQQAADTTNSLG